MKRIAIYPGTFDPITNGHVDLIMRAAQLFDTVIIAVAAAVHKSPYFNLEERLSICQHVLADIDQVKIISFHGLLVDIAKQHHARSIVRGLRVVSDFDYEFQLASMNRRMAPEIETVFLPAAEENAYISATMVKEVLSLGGDVSDFVHPYVLERMQSKI